MEDWEQAAKEGVSVLNALGERQSAVYWSLRLNQLVFFSELPVVSSDADRFHELARFGRPDGEAVDVAALSVRVFNEVTRPLRDWLVVASIAALWG